jgi:mercuric ion binding protein
MKTVKLLFAAMLLVFVNIGLFAQVSTKTENIKVWGNCEMCKARIEKAAKIEGVTKAEWSDETKMLSLVYNPSKVSSDDIQKKIAAVGHDTEKFKGDDKAYSKLPSCCKYDRKK